MKLKELLNYLPEDEHVYITGHVHPDGDCLGAALGLYQVLNKYRKTTVVLEERPESYKYLSGFSAINNYEEIKTKLDEIYKTKYSLIVMDSGDISRIDPVKEMFNQATRTINIDHHESNNNYGDYNYVDAKASSTCEMIGVLIGLLENDFTELTKEIAECLYTGIVYDTGVFRHSNTRKQTHKIAAYLVDEDIDFTWIINKMYHARSVTSVKAMKYALDNLKLVNEDKIVITVITNEVLEKDGLIKSDTESVVSFLNEIEGPIVSAFFLETVKGQFKVSFRANSFMNVCRVAKKFGGGGHIKASGCTVTGTREEVIDMVLKELDLEYKRNN